MPSCLLPQHLPRVWKGRLTFLPLIVTGWLGSCSAVCSHALASRGCYLPLHSARRPGDQRALRQHVCSPWALAVACPRKSKDLKTPKVSEFTCHLLVIYFKALSQTLRNLMKVSIHLSWPHMNQYSAGSCEILIHVWAIWFYKN